MKAKFLLLSLAACASFSSYAQAEDFSNAIQVKIKSACGLVVGGTTEQPVIVKPADNDDSQVFYMIQTSYNNWDDGRSATYPGFYLIQKSSGKYLVEKSWNSNAYTGMLAYTSTKPEYPDSKAGNWVPNNDALKTLGNVAAFHIDRQKSRPLNVLTENYVGRYKLEDIQVGDKVGDGHKDTTPNRESVRFALELTDYNGDIWLRGSGLTGSAEGWKPNNAYKLEKDQTNPGVYYHNEVNIGASDKMLKFCLQNDAADNYTLNLGPTDLTNQLSPFTVDGENDLQFVPWSFYNAWKVTEPGTYNLKLDLNNNKLFVKKGKGNYIQTGVEEIEAAENAPVRYFNLQGVPVKNPENGVYIRIAGNKATKVVVKK